MSCILVLFFFGLLPVAAPFELSTTFLVQHLIKRVEYTACNDCLIFKFILWKAVPTTYSMHHIPSGNNLVANFFLFACKALVFAGYEDHLDDRFSYMPNIIIVHCFLFACSNPFSNASMSIRNERFYFQAGLF